MVGDEDNWQVMPVTQGLKVSVSKAPPSLKKETHDRIDTIWQEMKTKHPSLYNGQVFCISSMTSSLIEGFWCEYRWILAQMRDAQVMDTLKLRSLAVTGVLECQDGYVFGKRRTTSVYLAGVWQGVPAGNVEAKTPGQVIDLKAQLLDELEEEIGFREVSFISHPVIACAHPRKPVVDLGYLIKTTLSFAEVQAIWRAKGNQEYELLSCSAPKDLKKFDETLFPTTKAILDALPGLEET